MKILDWNALDAATRRQALARPVLDRGAALAESVAALIAQVRAGGDSALRELTRRYDQCDLDALAVSPAEFDAADAVVDGELRRAIVQAHVRIDAFHRATAPTDIRFDTGPGVRCERVLRPVPRVGLYVPAGSAPLPSTALMLGVPAAIAGCPEVIVCTPADRDGRCDAAVLVAARLCGITRVFKLGGAQAIAAMAYGTASVGRCDKLFGPGNAWVTEAKRQVANDPDGAAIDMPAGPSEVLVIADDAADAEFVAADLLSQAEHGADSQVVLLSPSTALLERVREALERQRRALPRAEIAALALDNSRLVLVDDVGTAIAISNEYAPEHLILNVRDARDWLPRIASAGSVFLGAWSPEAVGDYCSGTNHVLPTYGHARTASGVSVASFLKSITVQELDRTGLAAIGPCAATLARAERLHAHERAVAIRLERIEAGA